MTIEVRDGVVRLGPEDWRELVESGSATVEGHPQLAGVVGLTEAVHAARAPVVRLQLDVASADLHTRHHAWVDHEAVALLAQVSGEEHQLMAMPPSFLAGALARLVGLGPRRRTGELESRAVEQELLDDLFLDHDLRRASAHQLLGVRHAWMLATFAPGPGHRLAVVEDEEGAWLVAPSTDGWQLVPTTATVLWRRLTSLLLDHPTPPRRRS